VARRNALDHRLSMRSRRADRGRSTALDCYPVAGRGERVSASRRRPPTRTCVGAPVSRHRGVNLLPESSRRAGYRRKRPLRMQQFLKAAARPAGTWILPAELLLELLVAVDYPHASLDVRLRRESPTALARPLESGPGRDGSAWPWPRTSGEECRRGGVQLGEQSVGVDARQVPSRVVCEQQADTLPTHYSRGGNGTIFRSTGSCASPATLEISHRSQRSGTAELRMLVPESATRPPMVRASRRTRTASRVAG